MSATPARAARAGGAALVAAALLFVAEFAWLAAAFRYPEVLDGTAAEVLPALLALGERGRAVWALYGLLPLLLLPAAAGAQALLRSRTATLLAALAAIAMTLGLLRWPALHWALAQAWAGAASDAERAVLAALFDGLNLYLGNYLGEFVGELALNLFFLRTALATRGDTRFPRWTAWAGSGAAGLGLLALWRNVTPAVSLAAELENWVLPLWMLAFGALLARAGAASPPAAVTPR